MITTKDKNSYTIILNEEDNLKEVKKQLKTVFTEVDNKSIKVFVKGYNSSLVTLIISELLSTKVKSLTFLGEGLKDSYKAI